MYSKYFFYLGITFLLTSTGCVVEDSSPKKIRIVATTGQVADAVRNVGGDFVTVEGLMGPGVDPHLYKASESDVKKLSQAKIIFYNGLKLEAKLEHILEKMKNQKRITALAEDIDSSLLLDSIDYKGHYDPHIWFDLKIWIQTVQRIKKTLCEYDVPHCAFYEENSSFYIKRLEKLNTYALEQTQKIPKSQRVLVTAHDAFRYFGHRYDFEVVGLQGISTQAEAGTADVIKLAEMIAKRKIRAIFVESSVPERNIKAVQAAVQSRGWNVKIGGELFSDALGAKDSTAGTFPGMFRYNIDTIVSGLKDE